MIESQHSRPREPTTLVLATAPDGYRSAQRFTIQRVKETDQPVVAVTADASTEQFVDNWKNSGRERSLQSTVIVVGDKTRSVASETPATGQMHSPTGLTVYGHERTADVPSLRDTLSAVLAEIGDGAHPPLFYIDAITSLVEATSPETVTSFVSTVRRQLLMAGADGYFVIDETMDGGTLARLASALDGVIEIDGTQNVSQLTRFDGPTHGSGNMSNDNDHAIDDFLEILRSSRRRLLLYRLVRAAGPLDIRELSHHVAAQETKPNSPSKQAVSRVYTSLRHVHLPKLVDLGVVAVDWDDITVTATEPAEELTALLTTTAATELYR